MDNLFKFYPNESKIYDYLFLPSLIHGSKENDDKENNHEEEVPREYNKMLAEIKLALKPHKEVIAKYYYEEISLIFLLASKYPFFDFASVEAYLDSLETLDDKEILKTVLYALEIKELDTFQRKEAMDVAEALVKDENQLMTWINKLSYNGETKWQLLSFTKAPKNSLKECIKVLRALQPIFYEYYSPKEKSIMEYGEEFINRLNNIEGDALEVVTNGTVKNSIFPGNKGHFLITYFTSYSIHLNLGTTCYVAWGRELEEFFKRLQELDESQQAERILLFKNLGDKTRYEVLKCIAKGITSTKVIAEQLGVSSATISYHISNLTTSKLIVPMHKEGRYGFVVNHDFLEKSIQDLKDDLK